MHQLSLLYSVSTLLHVIVAQPDFAANAFISPQAASAATNDYWTNLIFVNGDSAALMWSTNYLAYDVVLVHPYAGGSNTSVLTSMSSSNNGSAQEITVYDWNIDEIGDHDTYPMFYCQLVPTSGTQLTNIVSHNFNISAAQPTYTTSVSIWTTTVNGVASIIASTSTGVVLPVSASAATSIVPISQVDPTIFTAFSTTVGTASTPMISSTAFQTSFTSQPPSTTAIGSTITTDTAGLTTGAKIGLAVGITLGVIALALLAYLIWFYRHKHGSPQTGSNSVKYEAVNRPELSSTAQRPMYHEVGEGHPHELAGQRDPEELYAGRQIDHVYAEKHGPHVHLYGERNRHELSSEQAPWHDRSDA